MSKSNLGWGIVLIVAILLIVWWIIQASKAPEMSAVPTMKFAEPAQAENGIGEQIGDTGEGNNFNSNLGK